MMDISVTGLAEVPETPATKLFRCSSLFSYDKACVVGQLLFSSK
ncbi:hypothetical protein [Virgibacillus kimchii]